MNDNSLPKPVPKTLPSPTTPPMLDDSSQSTPPQLPIPSTSTDNLMPSPAPALSPQIGSVDPSSTPKPLSANAGDSSNLSASVPTNSTQPTGLTENPSALNTPISASIKPTFDSTPGPTSVSTPELPINQLGGTSTTSSIKSPSIGSTVPTTPVPTIIPAKPLSQVPTPGMISPKPVAPLAAAPVTTAPRPPMPVTPPIAAGIKPLPNRPQMAPFGATVPAVGSTPAPTVLNNGSTPPIGPVTPPKPVTPPPAQPAAPRKSILRFLPILLILLLILGALGGGIYYFMNKQASSVDPTGSTPTDTRTEITYWGLWEPTTVMQAVLSDFEALNPGTKVTYVQQSHKEYRERLQTAIATGQGPDVFRFHASWTPMLSAELSPLPERIMTGAAFATTFYPVAVQQLTVNDKPVGMPSMYDGLGLYYNKDIFSVANQAVPTDWEEVKDAAESLTIRSGTTITRGGIAMGTASNVEHFSDILGLMLLQNNADLTNPNSPEGQDALAFYTSFAETLKVWDESLPMSTVAFAKGDVAMMIAPSWRVHEIKALNPNLNFDIAPVPQLPGAERITWATYWAEGVSAQSRQKELAWKLVDYLASADVQQKVYSEARKERAFGPIYSRTDLAGQLVSEPYVAAFIEDAPYAKNWYLNGYTHDNGINDRIITYYKDAINAAPASGTLASVLETVRLGVEQVLRQYGLVATQPVVVPQE